MEKTHIIIKGIGWSQSAGTNWCYRYHDVTIITDNLNLLKLQGVYEDTFGSVTNCLRALREIKNVDMIVDDSLSETRQPRRSIARRIVGTDLNAIIKELSV